MADVDFCGKRSSICHEHQFKERINSIGHEMIYLTLNRNQFNGVCSENFNFKAKIEGKKTFLLRKI